MYRIITDNEKILKYAKKCDAQIIEVKKPLVVEVGKRDKKIPDDIVENFLLKFDEIYMESLSAEVLKYILENGLGCESKEKICASVAKRFRKSVAEVEIIIRRIYADCITNLPKEYKEHFNDYECCIHMMGKFCFDFVKACQEYLNKKVAIIDNSEDKLYIVI